MQLATAATSAGPDNLPNIRQKRSPRLRWIASSIRARTSGIAKHEVSLALAEVLFSGPHFSVGDDRFAYGEVREIAFSRIKRRLFVCVYTDRDGLRRIISLRKANRREVTRYGAQVE